VTAFQTGDHVFGVTNSRFTGAYATHALAELAMIAREPASIGDLEAASVPVVATTAWQALFEQAKLVSGQSVLIHGAAGNVGAYAVQMARDAGVKVSATAGAQDLDFVRSLGAAQVIESRSDRFEDEVEAMDAVVDLVGGDVQARSFAVLKPGGILVSAVSQPDQALAARHGVRAAFFLVSMTTERLADIAERLANGTLKAQVGTILRLSSAQAAHEMLDGLRPRSRGKVVLQVGDQAS
jgi:NADPH:quinone reductase-like Zn-dependent oxidoreductase